MDNMGRIHTAALHGAESPPWSGSDVPLWAPRAQGLDGFVFLAISTLPSSLERSQCWLRCDATAQKSSAHQDGQWLALRHMEEFSLTYIIFSAPC